MEYTILILLLPLLSFLTLGIGGKWMTHRTAGIIGTTVLAVVALLSYATAWQYFSAPRLADGTFATLMPYNVTWLPFTPTLSIDLGGTYAHSRCAFRDLQVLLLNHRVHDASAPG